MIVAGDGPAAPAAKSATTTIPIIFNVGYDPVISGLVPSLNRPGGNVTGVTVLGVEVAPKLLQVLHEWVPTATIIAALVNPTNPNAETLSRDLQAAARTLGLQLHILHASTERDFAAPTHSLLPGANSSHRWRSATRCPRFTHIVSSRRPAA